MGNSDVICFDITEWRINDLFDSYQGEGCQIGTHATFIRFAGCNLSCPWCDTKDLTVNYIHTPGSIRKMIAGHKILHNVILTGGEPAIQDGIATLIMILHEAGHHVSVETNGVSDSINWADWITCSPKAEQGYRWHEELRPDEIKYVIDDFIKPEDIKPFGNRPIWLMPQWGWAGSMTKTMELLEKRPFARLGIQAHKYWGIA